MAFIHVCIYLLQCWGPLEIKLTGIRKNVLDVLSIKKVVGAFLLPGMSTCSQKLP